MAECFIVQPIHPAGLDLLRGNGVTPRMASTADMATVAREIPGYAAVITRNAGLNAVAMRDTALQCASQILDALAGRPPPHLVQPETWDRRRGATP